MPDSIPNKATKSLASFAVPRAAIDALIDAEADAITIGAYLTLACHTDASGQFSTVGLKAIRENLGVNRIRAEKAVNKLCTIGVKVPAPEAPVAAPLQLAKKRKVSRATFAAPATVTIPLISTRETWRKKNGGELPDGPHDRAQVRHVLEMFGEPLDKRIWISSGLVRGNDLIERPLKQLKDCGDVAARLLLALHAGQDLDRWYGVPPHGFFRHSYKPADATHGQFRILFGTADSKLGDTPLFNRLGRSKDDDIWDALAALESTGLVYEAVVLLNRNPVLHSNGQATVAEDAEIWCDLGSPNLFGPVSDIERGLGNEYIETATDLGWIDPEHCRYLALIPTGRPGMICGLYRLRFRVTHYKNAFTEEVNNKHLEANRDALKKLNYLRVTKKLEPITRTLQSLFNHL